MVPSEENEGSLRKKFSFSNFPEIIEIDDELTLSSFTLEDASDLANITNGDEAIQRFIPWAKEDKSDYITRVNRNRQFRGPRYAVRVNGKLAGHIGIFPSHDQLGVIEIGYVLADAVRGTGVLDRALPICERLTWESNPGTVLALCINDENLPSQKVARRLGYTSSDVMSDGDRVYFKTEEQK
jgi:RimJ/RimL family protein N-acetyltransferase